MGRTVLELVRDVATELAADGKKVKVCVQQALGQGVFQVGPGVSADQLYFSRSDMNLLPLMRKHHSNMQQGLPLSLSGVRRIMERMDWGDLVDFVSFGNIGEDQIDDSQFYILVAPQNVVGSTIVTKLTEMVPTALVRLSPATLWLLHGLLTSCITTCRRKLLPSGEKRSLR